MHNTRRAGRPLERYQPDLTSFERRNRRSRSDPREPTMADDFARLQNRDVPHEGRNNEDHQPQPAFRPRTLGEYCMPDVDNATRGYFAPPVNANNFEIKSGTISLLESRCQFYGLPSEDPNAHISSFNEVCNTFKINNVSEDQIKLRLFPFTLKDKAKAWVQSQSSADITSWRQLGQAFLLKYFPASKTAKIKKDIMLFQQHDSESLYEAWERFKDLQRSCPHHNIPKETLVQTFYNASNLHTRGSIDAAAGGSLMRRTLDQAHDLLEELALNSCAWPSDRVRAPVQGLAMGLDTSKDAIVDAMLARNAALQAKVDLLTKQAALGKVSNMGNVAALQSSCDMCGTYEHSGGDCPMLIQAYNESVNFVGGQRQVNDPYSNTYNPGWKNHPNFGWRNNAGNDNAGPSSNFNSGIRPQQQPQQQGQGNFNNYGNRAQHPPRFQ